MAPVLPVSENFKRKVNMKKIIALFCFFAWIVTAHAMTPLEDELMQKNQQLQAQLESLLAEKNNEMNALDARTSTGRPTCSVESIPDVLGIPAGATWTFSLLSNSKATGTGILWRYPCGDKNTLVLTVVPSNKDAGAYVCTSRDISIAQNGVTKNFLTLTQAGQSDCSTFYASTNILLYGFDLDIDAALDIKYTPFFSTGDSSVTHVDAVGGSGGNQSNISNISGLWYDPVMNGLGFNIIHASNGIFVYYYGYTRSGQRLWLVSDVGPINLIKNQTYEFNLSEGTPNNGANFITKPTNSNGVSKWGTLTMVIDSCTSGKMTLKGVDGDKTFNIKKLGDIKGVSC